MKISLKDRILLPEIFPKEGKFETLIIISDVKKKIEITQEDIKKFEIVSAGNSITWNKDGNISTIDVKFTESEINTISDLLKKTSEAGKLPETCLDLYRLFVK